MVASAQQLSESANQMPLDKAPVELVNRMWALAEGTERGIGQPNGIGQTDYRNRKPM